MSKLGVLHFIWRVSTAVLVVVLSILTWFWLIPYLDRRLPIYPVILIIYLLVAYVLIPLVVRFWRIVMKSNHIPRYVLTGDGWPSDPVNIAIITRNKKHLVQAMEEAGWYKADPLTFRTGLKELYAIVTNTAYARAPLSNLYLFGRHQDIGFQIPHGTTLSPRRRHHVRFWRLEENVGIDKHDHFAFWFGHIRGIFEPKRAIWIGSATNESSPVDIRWPNLQLTHGNDGDPDGERDYIIETLQKTGFVKDVHLIQAGSPFTMRSQNLGMSFTVDGVLKVVQLRRAMMAHIKRHK